jgi:MarR family transcriptional regulator, organic hydroperoxide resistance regulator
MSVGPASAAPRAPAPRLTAELEFLRLIWAVDHGLHVTSKRMERTIGVTGPQRLVIRILGRYPGLTLARLAHLLNVHASTASGIVKRLEQRGLVSRGSDTRDRRRAYLGLTARGRRLDAEAEGTIEAALHRALASLHPDTVQHARRALAAIVAELERSPPG